MIPPWLAYAEAFSFAQWRLKRADGSPYLDRFVLHGTDALEYHDPTVPWSAFVHRIYTADGDRHMHDHPWQWAAAVVLSGGYTEFRTNASGTPERLGYERLYRPGDLNVLRPGDYHSIVAVVPETVTLFLCGRETSDWGFLVDGVHVPHRKYFKRSDAQHMTHERIA